jgi:2-amino-4-hydroxy-6-hydroxymethyldihydropteridine diphosphokinase
VQSAVPVAIALGSNLGDRRALLTVAVTRLRDTLTNVRVSSFHDTAPVGVGPQPRFLNGALTGSTILSPRALLDIMLTIEQEAGRIRPFGGAPRTLDLDLILYGDRIIDEPGLQLPHPRFRERLFVLAPLAEIAANWIDPVTGLSVGELRRAVRRAPL